MIIEVGKKYCCRDPDFFGVVSRKLSSSTQYVFEVRFYKQIYKEYYTTDSVTRKGLRFDDGEEDYLDLVAPLDKVCLGELR